MVDAQVARIEGNQASRSNPRKARASLRLRGAFQRRENQSGNIIVSGRFIRAHPVWDTMERETPITLSRTTPDERARAVALAAVTAVVCRPAPVVAYESAGTLAVIGPESGVLSAADSLGHAVDCTLVITESTDRGQPGGDTAERLSKN